MGRPSEVSDEDIIAAGRELAQRSAVTATGLWLSCGKRGRPARLLAVWNAFAAQAAADGSQVPSSAMPIPDEVRSEGTKLKSALTQGIDQAIGCIYQGIERAFAARYQEEFAALQTMRGATANEVAEALAALGDASEECASLRETVERQKDELRSMELSLDATRQNLAAMREQLGQQINSSMELRLAALNSESRLEAAKTEVARAQADRCAAEDRALQAKECMLVCQRDAENRLVDITRLTSERDQAVDKHETLLTRAIRAEQALGRGDAIPVEPSLSLSAPVPPHRLSRVRSQHRAGRNTPDTASAFPVAMVHGPAADALDAAERVRP